MLRTPEFPLPQKLQCVILTLKGECCLDRRARRAVDPERDVDRGRRACLSPSRAAAATARRSEPPLCGEVLARSAWLVCPKSSGCHSLPHAPVVDFAAPARHRVELYGPH